MRNGANNDIATLRRERVTSLRARGMTLREITAALADVNKGGMVNPETGLPFDLATISRDIKHVREQSKRAAAQTVDNHRARQYAELQEIKRAAWAAKDGKLALRALESEMKLLGTLQETITLNVNVELVQRVVTALESAGIDATDFFNKAIARAEAKRG